MHAGTLTCAPVKCSRTSRRLSARSRTSADREAPGCADDHRRHAGVGMQSERQTQTLVSLAEERGGFGPYGGTGAGFHIPHFSLIMESND